MIVTDLDDDDDMANPYNPDSGYDDMDDELYEEDDEIYWTVNIWLEILFYLLFF